MSFDLERLLDRPIAFQRAFMDLGAGVAGALFLSQAVYWSRRATHENKWFYKTIEEWTEETGLSRHEQDGARKKLKGKGILEIVKKGVPCRTFYRVNFHRLAEILSEISVANKNAEKRQTGMPESSKLACRTLANLPAENSQTITEITTETTSEITSEILSDSGESNLPDEDSPSERLDAETKTQLLDEGFKLFWGAYGRKESRKDAYAKFMRLKLPKDRQQAIAHVQFVIDQAKRWGELFANAPTDQKRFQPLPSSWINGERWQDETLPDVRPPLLPTSRPIAQSQREAVREELRNIHDTDW